MDNVRRVVTQGTTVDGKPSLVFPREAPRSLAEFLTTAGQLTALGFTPRDVQTFVSRLLRLPRHQPERRASELQNLSAYDFFVGRAAPRRPRRFNYSPRFDALLLEMPRVLAAFDTRWGDARTNLSTYLQLQLQMDRRDNKADGVLNGPTTESWFDHWYRHLVALGVRFVHGAADRSRAARVRPETAAPSQTPGAGDAGRRHTAGAGLHGRRRRRPCGRTDHRSRCARPAPAAPCAELDGFTTSVPPPDGPLQPEATRPLDRRDPYAMDEMGVKAWDRFQTLGGIQYYFDTEFQLLRGHMYYSGTEWALSSINQHGLWEKRPILDRDGHVSVLSVDIGDFNTPSEHLKDGSDSGKAARDCTADEIATEVWRQIVNALTSDVDQRRRGADAVARVVRDRPRPDHGRWSRSGRRAVRSATRRRTWFPSSGTGRIGPAATRGTRHGNVLEHRADRGQWLEDLEQRNVWQARHGGYQVHNNSVVFAGTWTKTFTRMTSMEAACESGRHAVNAILDHYIWVESGGADRRGKTDARLADLPMASSTRACRAPVRMPSPAGDYCYVFDHREPRAARHPHAAQPRCGLQPCNPFRRRSTDDKPDGLQPTPARLPAGVAAAARDVGSHDVGLAFPAGHAGHTGHATDASRLRRRGG